VATSKYNFGDLLKKMGEEKEMGKEAACYKRKKKMVAGFVFCNEKWTCARCPCEVIIICKSRKGWNSDSRSSRSDSRSEFQVVLLFTSRFISS